MRPARVRVATQVLPALSIVLLCFAIGTAAAQASDPQLAWKLQAIEGENIVATTWSPTASCVAVATDTTIHVIDVSGERLWNWNFRQTNRFIRIPEFMLTPIALSPKCDAVVIAGRAGYKYLWSAHRDGTQTFLKTIGTPLAVKFDLSGGTVAVTTGARLGYLLSPRSRVRWSGPLNAFPIRWPSQAIDASQSTFPQFNRGDVDQLLGAMMWGYGVFDSVSDDGQWRAVWNVPFRGGYRTTSIELWGPDAGGFHRRQGVAGKPTQPRWIKPMGCPGGELTSDGEFVVTAGDPDNPTARLLGDSVACDTLELTTFVFDRDGNTVLVWPHGQDREAMAAEVFARTGKTLRLRKR